MTLEEVRALGNDALRARVAELCGWEKVEIESSTWNNVWDLKGVRQNHPPPLYHCDLNAMHEAETTLAGQAFYHYYAMLAQACLDERCQHMASAPARQRAEAFVLAMQKKKKKNEE